MPRNNKTPPPKQPMTLSCSHKRRYSNEREAVEVAEYQMVMKPSVQLGVYHCGYCGKWHLTNIGKK